LCQLEWENRQSALHQLGWKNRQFACSRAQRSRSPGGPLMKRFQLLTMHRCADVSPLFGIELVSWSLQSYCHHIHTPS
jgi:hypothetical protein